MDDQGSLEDRIREWLDHQGYPLEITVAAKMRNSTTLDIRQGWHYEDPETNLSREIDLVCTGGEPMGLAEINFAIECKGTKKPWILFTSEDAAAGFNRLSAFALLSKMAFSAVAERIFDSADTEYAVAKKIPWLWKDGRIGYAIRQAFDGKGDSPYIGCLSALKASLWLRENSL